MPNLQKVWGEGLYPHPTYSSTIFLTGSVISMEMVLSGINMPKFRQMPEEYHV